MKIKKFNEELGFSDDKSQPYEWIAESILEYFFEKPNFQSPANSELIGEDKYITLTTEFFTLDLNPFYLAQIAEYIKFVKKYGKYKFYTQQASDIKAHDECLGIEANFNIYNMEKIGKEIKEIFGLKYHPDVNKFNL